MKLQIIFKIEDPKLESELQKNAKKFKQFEIADKNKITVNEEELTKRKNTLNGIITRIKDHPNTEFYIDNEPVSSNEVLHLLEIYKCQKDNKKACSKESTCKFIESVSLDTKALDNKPKWYEFGNFRSGRWIIDKEKIKHVINDEIKEKNLELCPEFSRDIIFSEVDRLPHSIDANTDKDWEYITDNSNFFGQIVGIRPKEEGNSKPSMPFLDNPLGSLFNLFNNLDFGTDMSDFGLGDLFGSESSFGSKSTHSDERDIPTTSFNDIGGMGPIIKQVREIIELPIVSPELLKYYSIKPHKGILLYGPPGCGKTLLAKAVANEINAHFIPVSGPEVLNKYVGQSEENLRKVFDEAVKKAPSIIYFDEFDSLATHRNEELDPYNARVVNQILTLLDGMDENERVCVIASTNRIDMIDEAVKRPGRFDYVLEVTKPDLEGCKEIFNIYTKDMPVEEGFNKDIFAEKYLFGCTGADIAFIATEAAYNSIRRTVNVNQILNGKRANVNQENIIIEDDFIKAFNKLADNKNKQIKLKK